MPNPVIASFIAYVARLRYPQLFKLTALLFVVDLIVPDMIPFIDEILLGLGTLLLGNLRKRRDPRSIPPAA